MSQRKYLRSIARHNAEAAKIEKMSKSEHDSRGNIIRSKFARNWREWARQMPVENNIRRNRSKLKKPV
ncbi:MAG: hypothetical protein FWD71_23880 [Oscillospiraceae bacterium]|nr:hypothetical protein [Oscillospiraceae bacterium]